MENYGNPLQLEPGWFALRESGLSKKEKQRFYNFAARVGHDSLPQFYRQITAPQWFPSPTGTTYILNQSFIDLMKETTLQRRPVTDLLKLKGIDPVTIRKSASKQKVAQYVEISKSAYEKSANKDFFSTAQLPGGSTGSLAGFARTIAYATPEWEGIAHKRSRHLILFRGDLVRIMVDYFNHAEVRDKRELRAILGYPEYRPEEYKLPAAQQKRAKKKLPPMSLDNAVERDHVEDMYKNMDYSKPAEAHREEDLPMPAPVLSEPIVEEPWFDWGYYTVEAIKIALLALICFGIFIN